MKTNLKKEIRDLLSGNTEIEKLDEILIIDHVPDKPGTYKYKGKILTPDELAHLKKTYWRVICFVPFTKKE